MELSAHMGHQCVEAEALDSNSPRVFAWERLAFKQSLGDGLDSYDQQMKRGADGSVDLYIAEASRRARMPTRFPPCRESVSRFAALSAWRNRSRR